MKVTIGSFVEETSRETGEVYLLGEMEIGMNSRPVRIMGQAKRSEKSPSHIIETKNGNRWVQVGAAWLQKPRRGGEEYYSCSLAHPRLQRRAMRVSVFPPSDDADMDRWQAVWSSEDERDRAVSADTPLDDEIQY